jgi:recombinase
MAQVAAELSNHDSSAHTSGTPDASMARSTSAPSITPSRNINKGELLKRLRAIQAEGLSLQAMANRLNAEGVPTLSGKGRWQKGTIGNLLAQAKE